MEEIVNKLKMEISHQRSNDWENDNFLWYYIKGIEYAIDIINSEEIQNKRCFTNE